MCVKLPHRTMQWYATLCSLQSHLALWRTLPANRPEQCNGNPHWTNYTASLKASSTVLWSHIVWRRSSLGFSRFSWISRKSFGCHMLVPASYKNCWHIPGWSQHHDVRSRMWIWYKSAVHRHENKWCEYSNIVDSVCSQRHLDVNVTQIRVFDS